MPSIKFFPFIFDIILTSSSIISSYLPKFILVYSTYRQWQQIVSILKFLEIVLYLTFAIVATGVPIKLLYQGEGNIVTVELKNGEIYRGLLVQAEDTMNCQLREGKPVVRFLLIED